MTEELVKPNSRKSEEKVVGTALPEREECAEAGSDSRSFLLPPGGVWTCSALRNIAGSRLKHAGSAGAHGWPANHQVTNDDISLARSAIVSSSSSTLSLSFAFSVSSDVFAAALSVISSSMS